MKENVMKENVMKENVMKENVEKENVKKNVMKGNIIEEYVIKKNMMKVSVIMANLIKTDNIKRTVAVMAIFFCMAGITACGTKAEEESVTGTEVVDGAEAGDNVEEDILPETGKEQVDQAGEEQSGQREEEQGGQTKEEQNGQAEAVPGDRIPMVMVNDRLYIDTGKVSEDIPRCGTMDGEITSTVDGSEMPTENGQSNFGSGFGYQYGKGDTIEIYMNEKWCIFEAEEK